MKTKSKLLLLILFFLIIGLAFFLITKNYPSKLPQKIPSISSEKCGIENCHGLEITCGPNIPKTCTFEYQLGDRCREFAKCEIIEGKCQLVKSQKFTDCKICVENCLKKHQNNQEELFRCEEKCSPS